MPVTGSEINDRVPVRGNEKIKPMIPVIGSKQNGRELIPVVGS